MSTHYRHFTGILKSIVSHAKSGGYTGQEVFLHITPSSGAFRRGAIFANAKNREPSESPSG